MNHWQVIDISDAFNQRYLIPHNSPIRFGVIYCPGVKTENYYFERVSDIIQASDLPKVVMCTRKVKGKDEKSNLSSKEVLIVIEVSALYLIRYIEHLGFQFQHLKLLLLQG